jgi:hypothetical protein
MLYVATGLAVMFGVVAVLGLAAIDEATRLVYRERLSTARGGARRSLSGIGIASPRRNRDPDPRSIPAHAR